MLFKRVEMYRTVRLRINNIFLKYNAINKGQILRHHEDCGKL